uniref:BPTI/Kunitz inhibitor domain-containing protein n=1 Tax=Oryza brachyantha TaxID=4533 RepID=J3N848_ORYBR
MAKCLQHTPQGIQLFCLVLLVCSSIPEQITGQTTNKIRSNMPMGVKDTVRFGGVKLNVCYQAPNGFNFYCSKDNKCYPTVQECLSKCTYNKNVRRGLRD